MTDPVAIVRTRLLAVSAVTALVATRVRSGILAQHDALPAIALQRVSSEETSQLRGSSGMIGASIQVHAVGTTRAQAVALQDAVAGDGAGSGLSHFRGVVGSTRVKSIVPEPVEREDYRTDPRIEYEIMRTYRVVAER